MQRVRTLCVLIILMRAVKPFSPHQVGGWSKPRSRSTFLVYRLAVILFLIYLNNVYMPIKILGQQIIVFYAKKRTFSIIDMNANC